MELEFLPCPTCREVTLVESPPCPDSHGDQCPDRACTVCGTALAFDGLIVLVPKARRERIARSVA
jgi:hypothetical protein